MRSRDGCDGGSPSTARLDDNRISRCRPGDVDGDGHWAKEYARTQGCGVECSRRAFQRSGGRDPFFSRYPRVVIGREGESE